MEQRETVCNQDEAGRYQGKTVNLSGLKHKQISWKFKLGMKTKFYFIISVRFHSSKPIVLEFPLLHGSGENFSNIVRFLGFKNAYFYTGGVEFSLYHICSVPKY